MPKGFPYEEKAPNLDVGSFTATLTYPLVLSWLLPVFVYNIVLEKQDKLREMMKMVSLLLMHIFSLYTSVNFFAHEVVYMLLKMGLKMRNYWIVTYLYNLILYKVVILVVYAVSYGFQFALFTQGRYTCAIFFFCRPVCQR